MNAHNAVEIENLVRFYGERKALAGVSFQVRQGEIFGLLGPNGGGKTTLFRILSTLLLPSSGSARVFGVDVERQPHEARRRIGVVFQSSSVDGKLTVAENLRHQGHLYGMRGKALDARIGEAMARLSIESRKDDLVETLSGGLRRRVELAKGMLHRPGLLILDEPSTGLDPGVRAELWEHLNLLRQRDGATVLVTTHLLEEAEKCDRLAILHRGELVAAGSPDELKDSVGGEVVSLISRQAEKLQAGLRQKFSLEASIFGQRLRFEHKNGHEIVPQLMDAFSGDIDSLTVGKPTLEDVFIRKTGRRFGDEENVAADSAK